LISKKESSPNIEHLIILCFLYRNYFIKINIEIVIKRIGTRLYSLSGRMGMRQKFDTR